MLVGLLKQPIQNRPREMDRYREILQYNKIPFIDLSIADPDFWSKVKKIDFFIFRWGHYTTEIQLAHNILPIIENDLGIKCFPDNKTCWHYDDKVRQALLMEIYGHPFVKTNIFWDKTAALEWAKSAEFPKVFKLRGGAGAKNVQLVNNAQQAKSIINKMFGPGTIPVSIDRTRINLYRELRHAAGNLRRKLQGTQQTEFWAVHKDYCFFQDYLPNNAYDIRVTTIGSRAHAFRRMNRKDDFRASGSGQIHYDKIDKKAVSLALKVSREMGFQTMAYDFLYNTSGDLEFCEISYTYFDKAIYDAPGYWDEENHFHEGHFAPPFFQLMDLLDLPDLKQPESLSF
jgi:glutathione synthase/RimK-type ligase-like ATP-grasp enzyme